MKKRTWNELRARQPGGDCPACGAHYPSARGLLNHRRWCRGGNTPQRNAPGSSGAAGTGDSRATSGTACHDTLDGGSSTEDDADGGSGDQIGFSFYGGYGPGSTARESGVVATAPAPSPRRITLEEYHARLAARGTLDDGRMLRHWRPALAMTRKETGVVRFLKVRVRRPWVT
jgi:hypothetical protein